MKPGMREEARISHPDKIMYPAARFTKRDVAQFYLSIAPVLLPHLRGRPITLKRYPQGVEGEFFYERRCPSHRPSWVDTATVHSDSRDEDIQHCVINDASTLVWVANLASLELHTLLSTQKNVDCPTQLMFDLDPGAPAGLRECAEVAFELKKVFDSLKLQSFLKTSGGKGLHFAVPLNTPVTFGQTKQFAHSVALLMEKTFPRLVISKMLKSRRAGKVLVDWSQNDRHKTTVAPYSLRAQKTPTVSTPVTWEELQAFADKKKGVTLRFEAPEIVPRIKRRGDLFAPVLKLRQKLPNVKGKSR
jgi:bifunctional non-homologous end joining protein LigD